MLARPLLFSAFTILLPCMVIAQDNAESACSFSCPPTDKLSQPLVKRPHAIGFTSFYSLFDCIYLSSDSNLPDQTCSYYKDTGVQALGSVVDHCMPTAVACSTSAGGSAESEQPLFSSQDKDEVPPWVENGRYHLYLKEHHRG